MTSRTFRCALRAALLVVSWSIIRPGFAEPGSRIGQIQDQIEATKALQAEATNDAERAQWTQRLVLLEQDLQSVQRRLALEAKEKSLAAEHKRRAVTALREALHAVDTDVTGQTAGARQLDRMLRELRAERSATEERREQLRKQEGDNVEGIADFDLRLLNQDEEIRAVTLERDLADLRVRLGSEADRIDEMLRSLPVNPRPTIRLNLDKRRYLVAERKQMLDMDDFIKVSEQQRAEVVAAIALSEEKISHAAEEIDLLEKKKQILAARNETRHLLYATVTEKKLLAVRLESQRKQLAAVDGIREVAAQIRDLYEKETAFLKEDFSTLLSRFRRRLLAPVCAIAFLVAAYLLTSRFLLPVLCGRDSLFVARRMAKYLVGLLVIVVLAVFFLEDLKQVATVLGIASAAVVIALQDLCSAFAGWFVIVAGRKFLVGDRVEIDGHRGDIIDVQLLRTTLLEVNSWLGVDEPTGRIIVIPNSFVFKGKVFNYSHVHPFVWNKVDITVTFETPANEAQDLLLRVVQEETRPDLEETGNAAQDMERRYGVADATYVPKIYSFIEDSGVRFAILYVSHYRKVSATRTRINRRIIQEFEKAPHLQFAYPTRRQIPTPEHGALRVSIENKGDRV